MRLICPPLWVSAVFLSIAACDVRDDPELMDEARYRCLQIAKPHVDGIAESQKLESKKIDNTSSDPTKNAFEFQWHARDILSDRPVQNIDVWCQGNATDRIISRLGVGGRLIIENPQKY